MTRFLLAILLLWSGPLWAEDRGLYITITKPACWRLVEHRPDDDVAYQPGRDVYGRPVVPADAGGFQWQPPEELRFPIEVDLARGLGLGPHVKGPAQVGTVTWRDGAVYLDGQPVTSEQQAMLARLCARKR
ncbi:hypothetical protein [Telmatospirillum sp. J64-1]|uniref:hypothetical protein n=1 Tax=Telmatospirillum sp. J64-1 TaxID=2502183 RepID=UPI00115D759C|nr:hypothetical protein [Telmatospirillum sp. J64-1]